MHRVSNEKFTAKKWSIRPYKSGDEDQIVNLFNATFQKNITEKQWLWKFMGCEIDVANVWVAVSEGRIIGHYGGTPMRFKLGDEVRTILHVADVMTEKAFQQKGVLTTLGDAAHARWKTSGIPFVTGLHYGGWGTRRHYLGWKEQFRAVWLVRPVDPKGLLQKKETFPSALKWPAQTAMNLNNASSEFLLKWRSKQISVEPISTASALFDEIWDTLKTSYPACVVRDQRWINYRYVSAPEVNYRILVAKRVDQPVGYLCYSMHRSGTLKSAHIVDLFTSPEDTAVRAGLLSFMIRELRQTDIHLIRMLCPQNTHLGRFLLLSGFLPTKQGFDMSIVPLQHASLSALASAKRWFTTAGDFDVV